jgi:hypothetical protein
LLLVGLYELCHRGLFGPYIVQFQRCLSLAPMRRCGGRLILGYQKSAATAAPHRRNRGALKVLKTPRAKNVSIKGEWGGVGGRFLVPQYEDADPTPLTRQHQTKTATALNPNPPQATRQIFSMFVPPGAPIGSPHVIAYTSPLCTI